MANGRRSAIGRPHGRRPPFPTSKRSAELLLYLSSIFIFNQLSTMPTAKGKSGISESRGVDIFFIISGFVMFYANRTQPNSIKRFLAARVLRIMPLYWFATLLIVGLFAIGLRPNGVHYLDAEIVAKSLFLIKSTFPDGRYDLVLNLGWTLIFEMFFYVVFAGVLIISPTKQHLT